MSEPENQQGREHHHAALDHGVVTLGDGADEERADTRPVEYEFDGDRTRPGVQREARPGELVEGDVLRPDVSLPSTLTCHSEPAAPAALFTVGLVAAGAGATWGSGTVDPFDVVALSRPVAPPPTTIVATHLRQRILTIFPWTLSSATLYLEWQDWQLIFM